MAEPVLNSVTAMATGKPLLAHGDQETRQLAVRQGQSNVMLFQRLPQTQLIKPLVMTLVNARILKVLGVLIITKIHFKFSI